MPEQRPGRATPLDLDDADISRMLRPVAGPSDAETASGRRRLLTYLASTRSERTSSSGLTRWLSPIAAIGGLLVFGVLAAGVGATGIGHGGTVQDLLDGLGVQLPGAAQPHVEGLPQRAEPDRSLSDASSSAQDTVTGSAADVADSSQPADAAAHGEAVSDAVHNAMDGTDPGPGRGKAVSEAACEAAHDRNSLPVQAQDKGPSEPKDCSTGGDEGTDSNQSSQTTNENQGKGNSPVSAPPDNPGHSGDGNPVGAPPLNPGQGNPPVSAPPDNPGHSGGGNPVGAPPPDVGQGNPPVTPGTPGNPVGVPTDPPGKPADAPGGGPKH
jgi:hypothetical protein